MRGSELTEAMAVDLLVNARKGMNALYRVIKAMVDKIGRFNRKDITSYLEAYRAEMLMRNIPEDRWLSAFPQVITASIHAEVLEVQGYCRNWGDFDGRLLEKYGFDDSLRMSKKDFMDWVEYWGQGRQCGSKSNTLCDEELAYER